MICQHPSRSLLAAALFAATGTLVLPAPAQIPVQPLPYPREQSAVQQLSPYAPSSQPPSNHSIGPQGEHLAEWMTRHQNLTPAQQQRALEEEPGFHKLPPETQRRMRSRLTELNTMSPERRQRLLARTEAMERLAPEQRQQVRSAMQGLASLPEGRRRLVARAFRDLRTLPPPQRGYAFNTDPRYSMPLTPQERVTLGNLLAVEPYLPPPQPQRQPPPQTPYPTPVIPYTPQVQPYR